MQVWLDGKFLPAEEARIGVLDAAVQHGVGIFETLQARHGHPFALRQHLALLRESALTLGLAQRLEVGALGEAIGEAARRNQAPHARIRITLTGGRRGAPRVGEPTALPSVLIVAHEVSQFPAAQSTAGIRVLIAESRLPLGDTFGGHKTIWYWPRLMALQAAAAAGCAEALWLDVSGHLAGASTGNLFLVKGGALVTPPARGEAEAERHGGTARAVPVRPGVTRAVVMELAGELGIPVRVEPINIQELLAAEEVFLTNTGYQLLPVTAIEATPIAAGSVGSVSRRLQALLEERLVAECPAGAES